MYLKKEKEITVKNINSIFSELRYIRVFKKCGATAMIE
jgi:hypothetical protein